ncbi:hypothetical protein BV133_2309 [Blastochloris viridis]|uniref:Uncharacterized protein n=1 Tax=Blastochloris viridis TaxID=1079 RepID=A0A182D573_BLAVI|nr:hypothetical protein BV133_2309 [Blastochloris viridis]
MTINLWRPPVGGRAAPTPRRGAARLAGSDRVSGRSRRDRPDRAGIRVRKHNAAKSRSGAGIPPPDRRSPAHVAERRLSPTFVSHRFIFEGLS